MIKQPQKSSLCGQCCLGTILNISLEEAIKLIGHKHGTRTRELARHFKTNKDKLTKFTLYSYSLCRVHYGKEKNTHWVLWRNRQIYDPIIGEWISCGEWQETSGGRITSSIEILN